MQNAGDVDLDVLSGTLANHGNLTHGKSSWWMKSGENAITWNSLPVTATSYLDAKKVTIGNLLGTTTTSNAWMASGAGGWYELYESQFGKVVLVEEKPKRCKHAWTVVVRRRGTMYVPNRYTAQKMKCLNCKKEKYIRRRKPVLIAAKMLTDPK